MAEDADDSQKTEEPTDKRLSEARQRGQVAQSRELNTWLMLLAGTLVLALAAPGMARDVEAISYKFIEHPHALPVDMKNLGRLMSEVMFDVLGVLALPFLIFFLVAIGAGLSQTGLNFASKALEPKFDKFNPVSGFKRLFSVKQLVEFLKGVVKITIVGVVATIPLIPLFDRIDMLPMTELGAVTDDMHTLLIRMLSGVLAVLVVVAIADIVFQRMQHQKQLRMTRQEVRDEYRQSEGDPMVKGKIRAIRRERARQRMMQAVPDADVVITNPTHFAVALKYKPDEMEAPICVAKGQDLVAQRIREVADENDIAIIENPPLARALFSTVEIDDEVPPQHYEAVAQVISYVWGLQGRAMPGSAPG